VCFVPSWCSLWLNKVQVQSLRFGTKIKGNLLFWNTDWRNCNNWKNLCVLCAFLVFLVVKPSSSSSSKIKGNCFRFAQMVAYFVGDSYFGGMTKNHIFIFQLLASNLFSLFWNTDGRNSENLKNLKDKFQY